MAYILAVWSLTKLAPHRRRDNHHHHHPGILTDSWDRNKYEGNLSSNTAAYLIVRYSGLSKSSMEYMLVVSNLTYMIGCLLFPTFKATTSEGAEVS